MIIIIPSRCILFSNDTGAMEYLRLQGALAANDSKALDIIDPKFRAEDGSWVGLSARSRVLMYSKDLIYRRGNAQNSGRNDRSQVERTVCHHQGRKRFNGCHKGVT